MDRNRKNRNDIVLFSIQENTYFHKLIKFKNSDNLNPKFTQSVIVNYSFSEYQNLKFLVVDVDHPGKGLKSQQLIGSYEIVLGKLLSVPGSSVTKKIKYLNFLFKKHRKFNKNL